jgi:transcriptional regulator GlxA family with amidase domain
MRIVPMSRRAFEMAFARRVGHSPGAEIHEIRMKRAKALLSETALTVTQIAAMTGFSDLAPFSRAFRASTGASPIQYRARQR